MRPSLNNMQDSDGDGTGDLMGITSRLDYLACTSYLLISASSILYQLLSSCAIRSKLMLIWYQLQYRWVWVLKHSGFLQSTGRPWQVLTLLNPFFFFVTSPILLLPVCISVSKTLKMLADFGYDISSYVDIDPIFGTLQDFDLLSTAAKVH